MNITISEAIDVLNSLKGEVHGEMTYEQKGIQLAIEALRYVLNKRPILGADNPVLLPGESPAEQYPYNPDSVSDPRD